MKLRPTRRAFFLRYSVYPYYLIVGILMFLFCESGKYDLENPEGLKNYLIYLGLWLALTMIPGTLLAFKRRRFGWFFWPGLLNLLGWALPRLIKVETINKYFADETLRALFLKVRDNGMYSIFILLGAVGMLFIEIYRLRFKYEVKDTGIELASGPMGSNTQIIIKNHITNIYMKRSFVDLVFGIGHIIIVTSSGIGAGDRGVFGGFDASAGTKNIKGGAFVGTVSTEKEFVANPMNCIYGISKPQKVFEEIGRIINS